MANSIFYRIVVPTDFSTCSEEAWRLARRVATGAGGELILTHALSEAPLYGESLTTDAARSTKRRASGRRQPSRPGWPRRGPLGSARGPRSELASPIGKSWP
jgi:nucleotide-binding universal stress UspA family protein